MSPCTRRPLACASMHPLALACLPLCAPQAVLVEADGEKHRRMVSNVEALGVGHRVASVHAAVGSGAASDVLPPIEKLLLDTGVGAEEEVTVMSIDIDAYDYLLFLNLKIRPRIVGAWHVRPQRRSWRWSGIGGGARDRVLCRAVAVRTWHPPPLPAPVRAAPRLRSSCQ